MKKRIRRRNRMMPIIHIPTTTPKKNEDKGGQYITGKCLCSHGSKGKQIRGWLLLTKLGLSKKIN